MKYKLLQLCCLNLLVILSLGHVLIAQNSIPSIVSVGSYSKTSPQTHVRNQRTSGNSELISSESTRFDLDFPGGSAQELIDALSKASGAPVNAFIPEVADQFKMPRLQYFNVSVEEVLHALVYAETTPIITSVGLNSRTSVEYRDIGYRWIWANNIWTMYVEALVPSEVMPIDFLVQPFSVDKLLDSYSIDAITTTIDSAWKLNGATEENEIMFHPETKILLVKCPKGDMKVMQEVLKTLHETIPEQEERRMQIRVSVLGEVNKSGNYLLPNGSTLTDAIAEAGGKSTLGNSKKITVKNPDDIGKDRVIEIDLNQILTGNAKDIELQNGATIVVPERVL